MKKQYNNLTIENLMKTECFNQFNKKQMREIREGLKANLDVSVYAKTEFNWLQMREIKRGLLANVDVSIYAKKELDWKQMFEIREKLLEEEKEKLDNEQENI